jgi:hypothetical protein
MHTALLEHTSKSTTTFTGNLPSLPSRHGRTDEEHTGNAWRLWSTISPGSLEIRAAQKAHEEDAVKGFKNFLMQGNLRAHREFE